MLVCHLCSFSQSQSYVMPNGQLGSLSWYQATIRDRWPIFLSLPRKWSTDIAFFFFYMGCPLWWEDGSVICMHKCYWTLPLQSLLGPSPSELETISCCLIWDWLSVTSYDSQIYGGDILTRLHRGGLPSVGCACECILYILYDMRR
jgi:hypothetical protein